MTEPARPPLSGIRVLEVGVFMAAPFAAMQLADLGAEVIKVEDPRSGDPVRASGPFLEGESSPYLRLNRNKESVALDLKSDAGREAFLALVRTADVVMENLRPGWSTPPVPGGARTARSPPCPAWTSWRRPAAGS